MSQRKVIVYIAATIDGFIAGPNDDLRFLETVQVEGEDYGYADFVASVDTVLMGRRTYDWVMGMVPEFPHADKESYIITGAPRPSIGNVQFYTQDPVQLVQSLRQRPGKHIFIDGGAQLVQTLMQAQEVDEIILSIIPVLLGDGVRLFGNDAPVSSWALKRTQQFPSGLVQLHYERRGRE